MDLHSFAWVAGLSFTMGVLALLVFLNPEKSVNLLIVGIIGKDLCLFHVVFLCVQRPSLVLPAVRHLGCPLCGDLLSLLIQLLSPDIGRMNRGDILVGVDRERTNRALI